MTRLPAPARAVGQWAPRITIGVAFLAVVAVMSRPVFQSDTTWNVAAVFAVTFLVFAGLLRWCGQVADGRTEFWLLCLYLVRSVVAIAYHQAHWPAGERLYRLGLTGYDAFRYDSSAASVAAVGWAHATILVDQFGVVAFYAGIYRAFGYNPVFAVVFNTLLGGLTAIVVMWLARLCTSETVARRAAVVTMVVPDVALYGGQLMKETLVMALFFAGLLAWFRYQTGRWAWAVAFVVVCYALLETRVAYVLILGGVAGISVIAAWSSFRHRLVSLAAVAASLVCLCGAGSSNYVRGANVLSPSFWMARRATLATSTVAQITREMASTPLSRESRETAGTPATAGPQASIGLRTAFDPASAFTYLFIPFRFVTFYFIPPFWMWGLAPDQSPFLEIDALMSWASVPGVALGAWLLLRRPRGYVLLAPFLIGTLVLSSFTPFVDARLKVAILPLFFLIALVGFESHQRWARIYILYGIFVILSATGYYAIKMYLA